MLYKNWPEICKVGRENQFLMIGLATLDTETPIGGAIARSLPLDFTERKVCGPVPLSVLKQKEAQVCNETNIYYISKEVAISLGVPTIAFGISDGNTTVAGPIPPELQGEFESMESVVEFKGERFLVLMDQGFAGFIVLALAECIDTTL